MEVLDENSTYYPECRGSSSGKNGADKMSQLSMVGFALLVMKYLTLEK